MNKKGCKEVLAELGITGVDCAHEVDSITDIIQVLPATDAGLELKALYIDALKTKQPLDIVIVSGTTARVGNIDITGKDEEELLWNIHNEIMKTCNCELKATQAIAEAIKQTAWESLPDGWTPDTLKDFWSTLTGDRKHKITACMKKFEGIVDNPGAFCGSLAREVGYKASSIKTVATAIKQGYAPASGDTVCLAGTNQKMCGRILNIDKEKGTYKVDINGRAFNAYADEIELASIGIASKESVTPFLLSNTTAKVGSINIQGKDEEEMLELVAKEIRKTCSKCSDEDVDSMLTRMVQVHMTKQAYKAWEGWWNLLSLKNRMSVMRELGMHEDSAYMMASLLTIKGFDLVLNKYYKTQVLLQPEVDMGLVGPIINQPEPIGLELALSPIGALKKIVGSSYEDFLIKYGEDLQDIVKGLKNIKYDELAEADESKLAMLLSRYDSNVLSTLDSWADSGFVDVRAVAMFAIANMNRYGTEPQFVLEAAEKFIQFFNQLGTVKKKNAESYMDSADGTSIVVIDDTGKATVKDKATGTQKEDRAYTSKEEAVSKLTQEGYKVSTMHVRGSNEFYVLNTDSSIDVTHPEQNDFVSDWTKKVYLLLSVKSRTIILAGSGTAANYDVHVGDVIWLYDDGNRTTSFGRTNGQSATVLAFADSPDAIKAFTPGTYRLYVMK